MKKIGVLIFLCLIFLVQLVYSESAIDEKVEEFEENKKNIEENIDKIGETRWDSLGDEIKNFLLSNKIVSLIDGFFHKINFVFVVLFGENYSFSLTLFFIIILWVYFFFKLSEILVDYSTFSPAIATAIGFGIAIIASQLKSFRKMVEFFGWVVFSPEAWWLRIIIFVAIVFILFFLYRLSSEIGESLKERRRKMKEELAKIKVERSRGIINSLADAIVRGLSS